MASTNDITDVVSGIVKKYIKPKYPIYRISYILIVNFGGEWDHKLITKSCSKLVEQIPEVSGYGLVGGWVVDCECRPAINKKLISEYEKNKIIGLKTVEIDIKRDWYSKIVDDFFEEDIANAKIIVHDLERVA
jgi:hypothetical protein